MYIHIMQGKLYVDSYKYGDCVNIWGHIRHILRILNLYFKTKRVTKIIENHDKENNWCAIRNL
jgi:hypothetical protein